MLASLAAAGIGLGLTSAAWSYQPAVNYQLHCMGCHLADGSGEAGRVPSLRRSFVLFSATPQGRDFVIRVPGVAQSPLSDADTATLLNWMARNLTDFKQPSGVSPGFSDYSAVEVHSARGRPLAAVKPVRARLLRAAAGRAHAP